MHSEIEKSLIDRCLRQEQRAYSELYQRLFSFLMNVCVRYKNDYQEAGAALNEIYLKIVNGLSDFDAARPFLPWVKTIAIRHLIDEFRSKQSRKEVELNDSHKAIESLSTMPDHDLKADDLLQMVRNLPTVMSKVFNLYALDGYKHKEIAEMLGITEGTSRWYLSKAREMLKAAISREEKTITATK